MKYINLILVGLFAITISAQTQMQKQAPYKAKALFKTDTLQYMEYDYSSIRSEYYKGKTVGEVLSELEYPVLYVVDRTKRGDEMVSISLGIRQVSDKPSPLLDYYINVRFTNPPKIKDFNALFDYMSNDVVMFTPQMYDFLKDLEVSSVISNPYIITKRANDLKKKEEEELKNKEAAKEP